MVQFLGIFDLWPSSRIVHHGMLMVRRSPKFCMKSEYKGESSTTNLMPAHSQAFRVNST